MLQKLREEMEITEELITNSLDFLKKIHQEFQKKPIDKNLLKNLIGELKKIDNDLSQTLEVEEKLYTISGLAFLAGSEALEFLINENLIPPNHKACKIADGSFETIPAMSIRANQKDVLEFYLEQFGIEKFAKGIYFENQQTYNSLGYAVHLRSKEMVEFLVFNLGFDINEFVKLDNSINTFGTLQIQKNRYNSIGIVLSTFENKPTHDDVEFIKFLISLGATKLDFALSGQYNTGGTVSIPSLFFITKAAIDFSEFNKRLTTHIKRAPSKLLIKISQDLPICLQLLKLFLDNGAYHLESQFFCNPLETKMGNKNNTLMIIPDEITKIFNKEFNKIQYSILIYKKNLYELHKEQCSEEHLKFLFQRNGLPAYYNEAEKTLSRPVDQDSPAFLPVNKYHQFIDKIITKKEDLNKILKEVFEIELPIILRTTREQDFPSELPIDAPDLSKLV